MSNYTDIVEMMDRLEARMDRLEERLDEHLARLRHPSSAPARRRQSLVARHLHTMA